MLFFWKHRQSSLMSFYVTIWLLMFLAHCINHYFHYMKYVRFQSSFIFAYLLYFLISVYHCHYFKLLGIEAWGYEESNRVMDGYTYQESWKLANKLSVVCVREWSGENMGKWCDFSVCVIFEALALALCFKSGKFWSKGTLIPSSSLELCDVVIEEFFLCHISS